MMKSIVYFVLLITALCSVNGERGEIEGCFKENPSLQRVDVTAATADACVDACERLYYR